MAGLITCFHTNEKIFPNFSTNYCFSTVKVPDCLKKFVETGSEHLIDILQLNHPVACHQNLKHPVYIIPRDELLA